MASERAVSRVILKTLDRANTRAAAPVTAAQAIEVPLISA